MWVLLCVALFIFAMGLDAWFNPLPLPTVRPFLWIAQGAYELGGRAALAAIWMSVSLVLLLTSIWAWRHTPKLPSDRWWRR